MSNNEFKGTVVCSLCLLRRPGEVLLARKMKKLVIGLWNGYGGRQEPGENIRTTTARETFEETNEELLVFPGALTRVAVVYFHNQAEDHTEFIIKVHVFEAWKWHGAPRESAEMTIPTWFKENKLPLAEMPVGDPYWLLPVLTGKKVIGHIYYGPKQQNLTRAPNIQIVDDLDQHEPED